MRPSLAGLAALWTVLSLSCGGDWTTCNRPLDDGLYRIVGIGRTLEELEPARDSAILLYDRKYTSAPASPTEYLALAISPFVPLELAGPPETSKGPRGLTSLGVTLADEHVATLEEFSRENLHGGVAIVIDDEVVTKHDIRGVISDGRLQITRCADEACQVLLLKLTD